MNKVKILLAAGIFFPDIGGPAIHVMKIAERLTAENFDVHVLAYGDDPNNTSLGFKVTRISRKNPKIVQWFLYSLNVLKYSINTDLLYGFDLTAAGIPPAIVSLIFFKPFILRIGGDPIWEREAETGRRLMSLNSYYERGLYRKDNFFLYFIIKNILKIPSIIVVYNQNFKNFYAKYFFVNPDKIVIIKNPVFKREEALPKLPREPIILFAGRFVSYKNLPTVIKALKSLSSGRLVLIGSGPDKEKLRELVKTLVLEDRVKFLDSLPQEKLFEYIRNSAICIAPALSEFNPNFILEALSFGKPVLLSKGHGLSIDLPEGFLFDPTNQHELETKMRALLERSNYEKAVSTINNLPLNQSWENVTDAHLALIKDIMQK